MAAPCKRLKIFKLETDMLMINVLDMNGQPNLQLNSSVLILPLLKNALSIATINFD